MAWGILTALVFMLTIGDKNRIAKSRMAGAFLGLRPRQDQSGEGNPQLRITKAGRRVRTAALGQQRQPHLGTVRQGQRPAALGGLRLSERGGKNAKKRAKVAVGPGSSRCSCTGCGVTGRCTSPIGYQQGRTEE